VQVVTRGPVKPTERSLTPDLARGVALLGIALANSVIHLHGQLLGPGFRPVEASAADRVVDVLVGVFVDNRAFPMFTLLFAYGLVMLARRQEDAGAPWPATRKLLLRRCAFLGLIGLAHLVLLFNGDILTSYGILGLALVLLLRVRDRTLAWIGVGALVVFVGFSSIDGLADVDTAPDLPVDPTTAVGALAVRAAQGVGYLVASPVLVLAFLSPAVVGVLLARRQVLERPAEHLPLLRRLTIGGFALSVPGAVPMVLATVQVWQPSTPAGLLVGALHGLTGLAGAVAFVALIGWLVAVRDQRAAAAGVAPAAPSGPPRGVVAVGQRSLTCYLLQSVMFVPLMAPWAGNLGESAGTAFAAALGAGIYVVTVLVAVALDRAGRPGPAEVVLRRLTYGPRPESVPASSR